MGGTRREFLRIGTASATVGLVGTAGCLGNILGGSSVPGYAKWFPTPIRDDMTYSFNWVDVSKLRSHKEQLATGTVGQFTKYFGRRPKYFSSGKDVDSVLWFVPGNYRYSVIKGSVSAGSTRQRLEQNPDISSRTHRGYTVYSGPRTAVAISDRAVVFPARRMRNPEKDHPDADERLETIVDAATGNADRFHRSNPDGKAVLKRLDGRGGIYDDGVVYRSPTDDYPVPDLIAWATDVTVDGETSSVEQVMLYESSKKTDKAAVKSWTTGQDEGSQQWVNMSWTEDYGVSTSGRVVTASGQVESRFVRFSYEPFSFSLDYGASIDWPDVTVEWNYDGETVTATHAGGDPVAGYALLASCGSGSGETPISVAGDRTYREGDVILKTTSCPPGSEVELRARNTDGRYTTVVLSKYTVPG